MTFRKCSRIIKACQNLVLCRLRVSHDDVLDTVSGRQAAQYSGYCNTRSSDDCLSVTYIWMYFDGLFHTIIFLPPAALRLLEDMKNTLDIYYFHAKALRTQSLFLLHSRSCRAMVFYSPPVRFCNSLEVTEKRERRKHIGLDRFCFLWDFCLKSQRKFKLNTLKMVMVMF